MVPSHAEPRSAPHRVPPYLVTIEVFQKLHTSQHIFDILDNHINYYPISHTPQSAAQIHVQPPPTHTSRIAAHVSRETSLSHPAKGVWSSGTLFRLFAFVKKNIEFADDRIRPETSVLQHSGLDRSHEFRFAGRFSTVQSGSGR